nr:MAG TPA: hypothetical protein [Caudoviricetes sp.]
MFFVFDNAKVLNIFCLCKKKENYFYYLRKKIIKKLFFYLHLIIYKKLLSVEDLSGRLPSESRPSRRA